MPSRTYDEWLSEPYREDNREDAPEKPEPEHTFNSEVPCAACGSANGCHEWWRVAEPLVWDEIPSPPPLTPEEQAREEEWRFERERFWSEPNPFPLDGTDYVEEFSNDE